MARRNFIALREFIDIWKEIRNKGKVIKDLSILVFFVTPGGSVRQMKGHIADDFRSFKVEGIPGIRLLKYPMGHDEKTGQKVVWAAYNSLTDIDFRFLAQPYPLGAITPNELENIACSNDLHSLLNTDYSMYMVFFAAGGFFFLVLGSLISVIYKIVVLIITGM